MTISVLCNNCQSKFKTDASHAGKSTRCPHCQQPIQVPSADTLARERLPSHIDHLEQDHTNGVPVQGKISPSATANKNIKPTHNRIAEQILTGFTGPIKRTRATLGYLVGSLFVALVMVLLPLIYIALIGLTGYGVFYHAVNHVDMLYEYMSVTGYLYQSELAFLTMLVGYSVPIFCGVTLILFMLKPLIVKRVASTRIRSLKRDKEPLLFKFTDRICDSLGAPKPTRIDLDCQLNASASYGRGFKSIIGNQLILTIGLPMVAGLNTRQFAGVLAHEFGHFAQGFGMRVTYLIRSISHWLHRVVYQRDAIDDMLCEAQESFNIFLVWIPYLATFFVWITRRVLWVLMMLGHFLSSYLLRQMEYDADRYEARLAGSDTFMQTAVGLQILGVAADSVFGELEQNIRDGKLVDDLPELILSTSEQLPEEIQEEVLISIEETPTRWFNTHPADRDRIANALREDTAGVFQVEVPSSVLFSDFALQSKATTWEYYREQFGKKVKRSQLVPVESLLAKQELENASQISLQRFFQGQWTVTLPCSLRYKHSQAADNTQQALQSLQVARQQMQSEMVKAVPAFQTLRQSQSLLAIATKMRYCSRAGLEVEIDGIPNKKDGEQEAKQLESLARKNIISANNSLEAFQNAATTRLGSALQLLHEPKVAERIPNSDQAKLCCPPLIQCYTALSDQMNTLMQITHLHGVLGLLIERLPNDDDDSFYIAIQGIARQVTPAIKRLRTSWARCPYPYTSADNSQTLATYLIPDPIISDRASSIFGGCDQAVTAALPLYIRLLGDLTRIAEAVETSLGLPPLPEVAASEG